MDYSYCFGWYLVGSTTCSILYKTKQDLCKTDVLKLNTIVKANLKRPVLDRFHDSSSCQKGGVKLALKDCFAVLLKNRRTVSGIYEIHFLNSKLTTTTLLEFVCFRRIKCLSNSITYEGRFKSYVTFFRPILDPPMGHLVIMARTPSLPAPV